MTTTQRKAKRKLTNIDFSGETSHIALVHKDQGGPAHGAAYKLALKNTNFSPEFIEKMQQIRVTLSVPDFLEKFFNLYGSNAEILARMLGYVPEEDDTEEEYDSNWYEKYIQEKLDSFEILKSLKDTDSVPSTLSKLNETQYLSLLTDQFLIEKALKEIDKKKESELVAKASESDNSTHASVEKSVEVSTSEKTKSKEKHMTKPVNTESNVEMVEKSAFVDLQKSLEDKAIELQKAMDTIATFKQEKQELINKSKTAQFTAVIKDEKLSAPIVKAALALESQEDFDALLGAVTEMQTEITKQKEAVEKSGLFAEQGATVTEDNQVKESAVARILKAKQAK
mgnify:FL=1